MLNPGFIIHDLYTCTYGQVSTPTNEQSHTCVHVIIMCICIYIHTNTCNVKRQDVHYHRYVNKELGAEMHMY